jgi:hypothetical protein
VVDIVEVAMEAQALLAEVDLPRGATAGVLTKLHLLYAIGDCVPIL